MFYHIVMLRFDDQAGPDFHARVADYAARVRRECAGVIRYDYGVNAAARGKGCSHAVLSLFESSAAHDAYQASPAHQEMKAFMMPRIAEIVACDAEPPEPAAAARP